MEIKYHALISYNSQYFKTDWSSHQNITATNRKLHQWKQCTGIIEQTQIGKSDILYDVACCLYWMRNWPSIGLYWIWMAGMKSHQNSREISFVDLKITQPIVSGLFNSFRNRYRTNRPFAILLPCAFIISLCNSPILKITQHADKTWADLSLLTLISRCNIGFEVLVYYVKCMIKQPE